MPTDPCTEKLKNIKKCHLHLLDLSLKGSFFNISDIMQQKTDSSTFFLKLFIWNSCIFKVMKFIQLEYSHCLFGIVNANIFVASSGSLIIKMKTMCSDKLWVIWLSLTNIF